MASKLSSTRTLWTVMIAGWAVLLLGLGLWSAHQGNTTVREMTTIGSARAVVDAEVASIGTQLPVGWQLHDQGYLENTCELTVARDGVAAIRTLTLTGPAGSEAQLLQQLVSQRDGARLRPGEGNPTGFFFDAGNYVAVRGRVADTGTIVIELATGCRAS